MNEYMYSIPLRLRTSTGAAAAVQGKRPLLAPSNSLGPRMCRAPGRGFLFLLLLFFFSFQTFS